MRTIWVVGLWSAVVLAGGGLLAQETFKENPTEKAEGEAVTRLPNAETARTPGGNTNRWRYKFHNGHWWYYGRGSQWLYWTGNAWTPYDRETYGQWFNGQPRAYRSDAGANAGARRPSGTIQREKNETRGGNFSFQQRRPANTIQRQKNESRGGEFGEGRRPPNTIQREKNETRGGD